MLHAVTPVSPVAAVVIGDRPTTAEEVAAVCRGGAAVVLAPSAARAIAEASDRLARVIGEGRLTYGITTGFGPLADRLVDPAEAALLQRNLVYHLATGVGAPLGADQARALMLARLLSIARGASGASPELVALMIRCLDLGLAAHVPEKGTVGASGDLTPSAHMALALMGEGAFLGPAGEALPAGPVLEAAGLDPYALDRRDGLALVNGTSCMTAVAALTVADAARLLDASVRLSVAHAEVLGGRTEAWHPAFGAVRPHPGQRAVHEALAEAAEGASRLDRSRAAARRLPPGEAAGRLPATPQDPYTIRCVPQVLGAVADVLAFHRRIVETELNAATDNPIFLDDEASALHGGNFYGQHVAFASDAAATALVKIAILAERQIARLLDERLNGGLPAFLQGDRTGLQSGFMGAQVTASALLAEMRSHAHPASIQSIPTNGNNQDVVSMGTIAARKAAALVPDLARILAIQALSIAQAMDLIGPELFSPSARAIHRAVRERSERLTVDRPLSADIERVAAALPGGLLQAA
jgi:tyrosine ammonia-lyase